MAGDYRDLSRVVSFEFETADLKARCQRKRGITPYGNESLSRGLLLIYYFHAVWILMLSKRFYAVKWPYQIICSAWQRLKSAQEVLIDR